MTHMPSENLSLLGAVSPQSGTSGSTGWVAGNGHSKFLAVLLTGASAAGDIDFKLERAKDAGGTDAEDITDHAIATIAQAGASDKQAMIELRNRALDDGSGAFTHLRATITAGTASLIAGVLFGYEPYQVVAGVSRNASTVVEVKSNRP